MHVLAISFHDVARGTRCLLPLVLDHQYFFATSGGTAAFPFREGHTVESQGGLVVRPTRRVN